jgi:hypothetical protein
MEQRASGVGRQREQAIACPVVRGELSRETWLRRGRGQGLHVGPLQLAHVVGALARSEEAVHHHGAVVRVVVVLLLLPVAPQPAQAPPRSI